MILIIDNYDSFAYNLARYVKKLGFECVVKRNDKITINEIKTLIKPNAIIISPGPCTPKDAGICIELIKQIGGITPILGVCLGHQAIGEAYGGRTIKAQKSAHGKASTIEHDGSKLFQNIPSPMNVGRYHSLITDISNSKELYVTSTIESGETMSIQHKAHLIFGVQFHPESVLTPNGMDIIKNFIYLSKKDEYE